MPRDNTVTRRQCCLDNISKHSKTCSSLDLAGRPASHRRRRAVRAQNLIRHEKQFVDFVTSARRLMTGKRDRLVIKAYDHKYQQYVALKLVRNEKRFHRQADEEIRIL
ncbi:hypothetical protein ANCDUO_18445, partial [Ancylostoma duodenale]